MFSAIKKIKTFLLDLVFPIQCLGCQCFGSFLCIDCFQKIRQFDFAICPVCKRRLPGQPDLMRCFLQNHRNPLLFIFAASSYENPLTQRVISLFKYRKTASLAKPLGQIIAENLKVYNWQNFIMVPVPLHPGKMRQRGFNQAELLAQNINQILSLPIVPTLKKTRNTKPQVGLPSKQRLENQTGAFGCIEQEKIKGKNILLIDDVFTTGATLTECARILKQAGAKKIGAAVIAR